MGSWLGFESCALQFKIWILTTDFFIWILTVDKSQNFWQFFVVTDIFLEFCWLIGPSWYFGDFCRFFTVFLHVNFLPRFLYRRSMKHEISAKFRWFFPKISSMSTTSYGNVLDFRSGKGYWVLLFTKPNNKTISNKETSTLSASPILYVFDPVNIRITNDNKVRSQRNAILMKNEFSNSKITRNLLLWWKD